MTKHFFLYWKLPQVLRHLNNGNPTVGHLGSEQLDAVAVGDVIWIITVEDGLLLLAARFPVEQLVDREEAMKILGTDDVWESARHAICGEKNAIPMNILCINNIVPALNFSTKKGASKILSEDDYGTYDGKRLQTMRCLAPDSVDLVEKIWSNPELLESDDFIVSFYKDFEEASIASSNSENLTEDAASSTEGRLIESWSTRRERDPSNRARCLANREARCAVCEMSFLEQYGEIGRDFIHVHHEHPIGASNDKTGDLHDPENAMKPVCPNCHAMLHRGMDARKGEVRSISALRDIRSQARRL